jgi:hypothetical protein
VVDDVDEMGGCDAVVVVDGVDGVDGVDETCGCGDEE